MCCRPRGAQEYFRVSWKVSPPAGGHAHSHSKQLGRIYAGDNTSVETLLALVLEAIVTRDHLAMLMRCNAHLQPPQWTLSATDVHRLNVQTMSVRHLPLRLDLRRLLFALGMQLQQDIGTPRCSRTQHAHMGQHDNV